MATIRMTGAAVLDTAIVAATAASSLISSVGAGASMLNASIGFAQEKQAMTIKVNRVMFKDVLMRSKTVEIAQSRKIMDDYVVQNPDQADLCKQIWDELNTALA